MSVFKVPLIFNKLTSHSQLHQDMRRFIAVNLVLYRYNEDGKIGVIFTWSSVYLLA